jgi:cell division transport system ATP-binding protein
MAIIEFQQVSKRFDGKGLSLSELSFAVDEGELLFLAGPSGAGKSTLLNLIAAIDRPTSGMVRVQGQNVAGIGRAGLPFLRRKLGLILQQQNLLLDRSALQNVMLPLMVAGSGRAEARNRALAALERVGLREKADSSPLSLSGGEQQRVAIARAIVHRPQIILADEPTANLDRDSANQVLDILKTFNRAGVTCLVSTHDEQFLATAKRVMRLHQGKLVSQSTAHAGARA